TLPLESADGKTFTAALEPGRKLPSKTPYTWWVTRADGPSDQSHAAQFWVVDPVLRAKALVDLRETADPAPDLVMKASVLLALGLARETVDPLDRLPASAPPSESRQALLLRAKALENLGDAAGALQARDAWLQAVARPDSR